MRTNAQVARRALKQAFEKEARHARRPDAAHDFRIGLLRFVTFKDESYTCLTHIP
ncbi:MAG TPA: hypothetical protein VKF36_07685 [Syntrophorhabdales bacterium]|nr:hypothetical protein [Syntrophorhabdales bacterium]